MADDIKISRNDVVLAAGGLVWRDGSRGRELAVVHRPVHHDWTLPKGKLDPGERWQEAALREVLEETGLKCDLGAFAGGATYLTSRGPKVVLYWHMTVAGPQKFAPHDPEEVDALDWLLPAAAWSRLTYEHDRHLLNGLVTKG